MPNVDSPWGSPQPTQHCPLCEEAARKLADCQAQLAVATSAIDRAIQEASWCYDKIDRDQEVKAMKLLGELVKDLKERKARIIDPTPTDLLVVKREDLEYLMEFSEFVDEETRNRLNKALENL